MNMAILEDSGHDRSGNLEKWWAQIQLNSIKETKNK